MPHQPYPQFSTECASDLYRIITTGQIAAERSLFAKCVYTLQGAGFDVVFGEPAEDMHAAADAVDECDVPTAEKCLAELERLDDEGVKGDVFGATANAEAIDPATLAMLIQLAVTFIKAWIDRRKPK